MSAATPRTISNAPDLRQLMVAVGALILAVALLVAVTISRQSSGTTSAPAAVPASVAHDHGWSSSTGSQDLTVSTGDDEITYPGIPYVTFPRSSAPVVTGVASAPSVPYVTFPQRGGLVVATENGGILYTGIPYAAPDTKAISIAPAVGEFRLAPGNQQPVGVVGATTGIVPAPAVPYVSLPQSGGLVVATQNGGILYTGIPYPAPETDRHAGGSNGTRFPQ